MIEYRDHTDEECRQIWRELWAPCKTNYSFDEAFNSRAEGSPPDASETCEEEHF